MKRCYGQFGLIMLVLMLVACAGSETAGTETGELEGHSTDALGRVRFGETVSKEGYSMVVNELVDPATPLASYNQTQGERMVSVHITIKNESNETPLRITPHSAFLLASNSFIYGSHPLIMADELAIVDLAPGDAVSGWVGFEIPDDEKPLVFS